ncbi:MAG: hypothetical protein LC797_03155 [Chloroflexi bacterium]|nr:hypothetical protein [Chloroflexota bacterium]
MLAPLLLAATLLVSACAPSAGDQLTTPAAPAPSRVPASPVPSVLPGSVPSADPQPLVEAALRDAAAHLGISAADLHVDQVDARQWGDSSLGCPQPGLMYSQIVTPGFVIIISGAGKQLEYHSDTRGPVVLCQER